MRVLQLGPFPPPHGGVETNLVSIRRYLRERGIPCAVVNLTRHRRPDADDVYYPRNPLQVIRLLLRLQYDVLHVHFGGNITPRLLALWLACCLIPGKKSVLTFHSGGYPSSAEGRTARPATLRGLVFRRFDRVIAVNPQLADLFRRFGVRPDRVRVILPFGFFSDPVEDSQGPQRPDLAAFFRSHDPVLSTVGGLEAEYDIPLQIDLIERLLPEFPNLGLAIAGGGSQERTLRALIKSKPFAGNILLCGDVEYNDTQRLIRHCRVFLRTTLYDGDSIAVREALHAGTPVVTTDNGMRPQGVHLFPPSNLAACLQVVQKILAAPAPVRQIPPAPDDSHLAAVLDLYREMLKAS